MTEQTQRAPLQIRLSSGLAARSQKLLETLDEVLFLVGTVAEEIKRAGLIMPATATKTDAAITAAEALLRETTRAMLGESL